MTIDHGPSRRSLLRACGAGVVLAALSPGRAMAGSVAGSTSLYARSRFAQLRKARFTLSGSGGSWPVTLEAINDLTGAAPAAEDAFVLKLAASAGPADGTYSLARPRFTATPLFVVSGDGGRTLHAIVNSTG